MDFSCQEMRDSCEGSSESLGSLVHCVQSARKIGGGSDAWVPSFQCGERNEGEGM